MPLCHNTRLTISGSELRLGRAHKDTIKPQSCIMQLWDNIICAISGIKDIFANTAQTHTIRTLLQLPEIITAMNPGHQNTKKQADYYGSARSDMLAHVPEAARTVLEIGCGNGAFSRAIQQKSGAEVWGVEPFAEAAEHAGAHLHKVFHGFIEQHVASLPDQYFDCICMNDVIEHLVDPWLVLSALRTKLKPNGTLIASIPNVRHYKNLENLLFKADWLYTDAGILDRTHLRFFTHKSMHRLFEESGYRIANIQGLRRSHKFKLKILNLLSGGKFWDICYLHFAVIANPMASIS